MIKKIRDWMLPVSIQQTPKILCPKHGVHRLALRIAGEEERYCGLCFKEMLGEPVKVVE